MKKLLAILLAAMLAFSCVSALAEGEKITLKIYAQYADDDTKIPYDYAVEKLAEAYPNVTLELIPQAQDDGATLRGMLVTGLPDIYQTGSNVFSSMRNANRMMVLNETAEKTGFASKVYETCKEFLYADDGNIYAFPYAGHEYVLLYVNKALFEKYELEIPTTFEEMKKCAEVFNANGIVPLALFAQEGWNAAAMFDIVATRYNAGGIKALDNGTAKITDEAYVKAAEVVADLAASKVFQVGATDTNYDQASEMFLSGQAAMFINGQWYIPDAEKRLGEDVIFIPYPSYDEEAFEASKYAYAGGGSISGYAVDPQSPNAALAAEVAAFISEKYCEAKVMLRNNPLVAVNTGLVNENFPKMMQDLVAEMPNMTSTTAFTWGLTNTTWSNAIGVAAQSLLSGQFTAQEVIDQLSLELE